jgi:tetratricopeptide (TPR) repeat protein
VVVSGAVFEERFEALRKAGSGAMATVFRARDRRGGGFAAVKILRGQDAHDVERFAREASILSGLGHPGIVRYVAHGVTAAGEHYLAMEWLDGEDLAARLARRGLTGAETLALARRAADALAFAHARGLVHRDLKPSNLFLVGGDVERLKIVDFGIAGLRREGKRLTSTGALLGTPGYIAPEQIQGAGAFDPRADVFSLGCVLFECLTGRPAFEGTTAVAVLVKILLQEVPRTRALRPEIPEALDDLVARMMARDVDQRPRDAAAVLEELDRMGPLEPLRALGSPPSLIPRPGDDIDLTPVSLTMNEHRLVTIVLAGDPEADVDAAPASRPGLAALRGAIEPLGGRAFGLSGGAVLVTQWGASSAVDRAERAVRCALALKERFAGLPVCVITGRGDISAQVVEGDLIERAVMSLGTGRAAHVWVDEATAGLVGGRLRVDRHGKGHVIRPERAAADGAPLLLGKVTPFVGRARELSMLEGVLSGAVSEPAASAVLVVGDAGTGKTRLRRELCEALRRRHERVEVLIGASEPLGAGAAFGIIADALRRSAGIVEGEALAVRQAKLRARLSRHVDPDAGPRRRRSRFASPGPRGAGGLDRAAASRITMFLGELCGAPFASPGDDVLRAARESPRLMGDAIRAAWEDWLAAECAAHPVLIVLDNLQWSDAASIKLIDGALRNLKDLPLMVVGLARPEALERFPGLWAERDVQLIKLGGLSQRAAEQLVRAALGEGADPTLVARILDRAENNPFYLEELVRAVAGGRSEALPDSVLGTVEARLDAEGPEAKRVLRAASVYGHRFTRGGVVALLAGRTETEVGACLDALAAREILVPASVPDPAGDPAYVFAHALVREAAYATLTEADRALGHLLAGSWLEASGRADPITLAEHFRRGAEPARAAIWYRRAAELALEADDLAAAVERTALGVASGAAGEELGELYRIEAEAAIWRGDLTTAEARAMAAAGLLAEGTVPWFRALALSITAAGKIGGFDRIEERMALAARTPPARGAVGAQLACLGAAAINLLFCGRHAPARAMIARLRRVAPDPTALEPTVAASLQELFAADALYEGDPGLCLEGFEAALGSHERAGDRRNACAVRTNLGMTFTQLGDFESAEEVLRSALASAERMGLADLAAVATQHLGLALTYRGRLEEAEQLEQRAADAFHELGDPRMEGSSRTYLAMALLAAGQPARAEREARAAIELLRIAPPLRAAALAVCARTVLAQARCPGEARALATEARTLLESLGSVEEGESLVRLVELEALAADGDREAFASAGAEARRRLLERAARIADPAWRERFLTAVVDNARTLAITVGASPAPVGPAPVVIP